MLSAKRLKARAKVGFVRSKNGDLYVPLSPPSFSIASMGEGLMGAVDCPNRRMRICSFTRGGRWIRTSLRGRNPFRSLWQRCGWSNSMSNTNRSSRSMLLSAFILLTGRELLTGGSSTEMRCEFDRLREEKREVYRTWDVLPDEVRWILPSSLVLDTDPVSS